MSSTDENGVRITLPVIYDKLLALDSKVDNIQTNRLRDMKDDERVQETLADHSKRLSDLEKWRHSVPAAVILAVSSPIVTYLIARG